MKITATCSPHWCVPRQIAVFSYIYDARFSLLTVVLAGFGRAVSEVGAVIVVGGNIDHLTRVMTTTIALETSKGELELALALGVVLMGKALLINAVGLRLKNSCTGACLCVAHLCPSCSDRRSRS